MAQPDAFNIVWFKRDLRAHDHAPLAAAAGCGRVVPLYIVEPALWRLPDSSRRHWCFIRDSLLDLHTALQALGAGLVIRLGEAAQVLQRLLHEYGHFTLWSHEETGNAWTYARDKAIKRWCRAHGVMWHEFPTNGVVRCLASRDGWARQRDARMMAPCVLAPTALQPVNGIHTDPLPPKHDLLFGATAIGSVQAGGRRQGLKTLQSFLQERCRHYLQTIAKPGVAARHCSRLSAHLAFGTLSAREVEQATQAKLRALADNPDPAAAFLRRNLNAFLSRLAWRCHFVQKLEQQPAIEYKCMHPALEGLRSSGDPAWLAAWAAGATGYPLIDACMRSLHDNGWLTFRMRALVVSFASYHLWLDWRQTGPLLAQLFTDYEPGIHYAQLQMQSGVTGINAVRIYNPLKQSSDHDPQGRFIRRYIPELKEVPTSFIHQPWLLPTPPSAYPKPLVRHEEAVKKARALLAKYWRQDGFREQTKMIQHKLGSRANSLPSRSAAATNNPRQLRLDI